jgi:uncharacterized protein
VPPAEGTPPRATRHDPVAFARVLRSAGLDVPVSAVIAYTEALAVLGTERPDAVYWAGRATLVRSPVAIPTHDACFASFFLGVTPPVAPPDAAPLVAPDGDGDTVRPGDTSLRWSRAELLARRDVAGCSPEELEELWPVVDALRFSGPRRRARRTAPDRRTAAVLDLRRTVRSALRTAGEPVRRHHRRPTTRPRRVVLLVDVSGSMEPYARVLLRFAHAAVTARRSVEVFALGTRLTRLTRELASHDPDAALRAAAAAVVDRSGGTRLGDTLGDFNDRWGLRGMARGADVVVLSDGWDRGDPARLEREMERLHRVAHRIVWVNPLRASPGYAPLARGMAAALPHVDRFVDGHSVNSLRSLAEILAEPEPGPHARLRPVAPVPSGA